MATSEIPKVGSGPHGSGRLSAQEAHFIKKLAVLENELRNAKADATREFEHLRQDFERLEKLSAETNRDLRKEVQEASRTAADASRSAAEALSKAAQCLHDAQRRFEESERTTAKYDHLAAPPARRDAALGAGGLTVGAALYALIEYILRTQAH